MSRNNMLRLIEGNDRIFEKVLISYNHIEEHYDFESYIDDELFYEAINNLLYVGYVFLLGLFFLDMRINFDLGMFFGNFKLFYFVFMTVLPLGASYLSYEYLKAIMFRSLHYRELNKGEEIPEELEMYDMGKKIVVILELLLACIIPLGMALFQASNLKWAFFFKTDYIVLIVIQIVSLILVSYNLFFRFLVAEIKSGAYEEEL